MIGYVYKTTNLVNGRMYIGKHHTQKHNPNYLGSGEILIKAIKVYGKENFQNEILVVASSEIELDMLEKEFIQQYKSQYGGFCYNLAGGGEGGNTLKYASEKRHQQFIEKMTLINKARCSTEEFRNNTSRRVKLRYSDPAERELQSQKIRKAWSNPELRQKQSIRTKEWYKTHTINRDYLNHPCYIIFQGKVIQFSSEKECREYLQNTYNYIPTLSKCNPYKAFHKCRSHLNGLIFGYGIFQRKSVTTNPDECKDVGAEIGTASKRETTHNVLKR